MQVQTPPQQQTVRSLTQLLAMNKSIKQLYLSKHQIRDFDLEVPPPLPSCGLASLFHVLTPLVSVARPQCQGLFLLI